MKQLPSVTTVLSGVSAGFVGVDPEVLQAAAERGTLVHKVCAEYCLGKEPEITPEIAGYFLSFQSWFDRYVDSVCMVEAEFSSPQLGYMGHPDLICAMKGSPDLILVDLKTPLAYSKLWKFQIAAYAMLARNAGVKVVRGASLRLKRFGGAPIVNESKEIFSSDYAIFRNALAVWRAING